MKKFNRKYICYKIYTISLCRAIDCLFDYYGSAVACMKNPENYLIKEEDIDAIKAGACVIRKVTQEWFEK